MNSRLTASTVTRSVRELPICVTCGVQYGEPRGIVPGLRGPAPVRRRSTASSGRRCEALRGRHTNRDRATRAGCSAIGTEPKFAHRPARAAGPHSDGNVLWDCVTLLDDETEREIDSRGGLHAIAISHPHYYSTMVEWAHRFDCPVLLHEADREWVMRDDPKLEFWSGETYRPRRRDDADPLRRALRGRHRAAPRRATCSRATSSRSSRTAAWVSFMYSFPNYIPLPESAIRSIEAALGAVRVRADLRRVVGHRHRRGRQAASSGAPRSATSMR